MFVQPARGQEIKFHENEEENYADLNEIEKRFHVDPPRIFVLVQEQGHSNEHIFEAKKESHGGRQRRFTVQHYLVVQPAEIGYAPGGDACAHQQP